MLGDELIKKKPLKLTRLSTSLHIFQSLIPMAEECLMERVEVSMTFSPASGSMSPF